MLNKTIRRRRALNSLTDLAIARNPHMDAESQSQLSESLLAEVKETSPKKQEEHLDKAAFDDLRDFLSNKSKSIKVK